MAQVEGASDFEAEMDLDALQRVKAMEREPSRFDRVASFVQRKQEALNDAVADIKPKNLGFNGSVRSKRSL